MSSLRTGYLYEQSCRATKDHVWSLNNTILIFTLREKIYSSSYIGIIIDILVAYENTVATKILRSLIFFRLFGPAINIWLAHRAC